MLQSKYRETIDKVSLIDFTADWNIHVKKDTSMLELLKTPPTSVDAASPTMPFTID